MPPDRFEMLVYWGNRREEAESCAIRLQTMMSRLADCDVGLSKWCKPGHRPPRTRKPLADDLRTLTKFFDENRDYKDCPRTVWPEMGFHPVVCNDVNDEADLCGFLMRVGAFDNDMSAPNHLFFDFPRCRPDTRDSWTAEDARSVLRAIVEPWEARFAVIVGGNYSELVPRGPDNHYLWPWAYWITYLAHPHPALVQTPAGIQIDRLPDGGAIWTLCEERFDASNPVHVSRTRAMNEALKPVQQIWDMKTM